MRRSLARWWRSRLEVLVSLVVCIALVCVSVANAEVVSAANLAVNNNWRGLYDVLVTAPGQTFGGSSTSGLVDSNFVTMAGQSGISLSKLAEIRAISDVSVAAPIGLVGSLRDAPQTPSLILIDDPVNGRSDLTAPLEVLRLESTLTEHTSLGNNALSKSVGIVAITRRSASTINSPSPGSVGGYPNGFAPQSNNLYYQVPLGALPSFPTTVIAIDPKSEIALLGSKAGAYLKGLLKLPAQRTTANGKTWATRVDSSKYLVQQTAIQQAVANKVSGDRIVPLLVNASQANDLTLTVSIQHELGGVTTNEEALSSLLSSGIFSPPTVITKRVPGLATPFASPDLSVLMPGSELPKGETAGSFYGSDTGLLPQLVSRPTYAPALTKSPTSGTPAFRVKPDGVVTADGGMADAAQAALTGQQASVGLSRAYRATIAVKGASGSSALAAPVGQFSNRDLESTAVNSVSYVPSGIYDGSKSTLVQRPNGPVAGKGISVKANLSGVDFLSTPPGAFTDLQGGEALRGSAPIDAVRVRVAGIHSYSTSSRHKVEDVAAKIARLGLQATIVAGSSPEPVEVYVPSYRLGERSPKADLGWVRQSWTTLGAAVTVSSALTSMQYALQITALAAVLLAFATTTLIRARRRQENSRLLRDLGWSDSALRRYWLASQAPSVLAVILVGAASYWFAGPSSFGSLVLTGVVVFVASVTVSAVTVSTRAIVTRSAATPAPRRSVESVASLAWRHVMKSPSALFLQVFALLAVGMCTAIAYGAISGAKTNSGHTRLAELATSSTALASLILGLTGVAAAIVLGTLGRRAELARREGEAKVLVAIGFDQSLIALMWRIEAAVVSVLGLFCTLLFAGALGVVVTLGPWGLGSALVACAAAALVLVLSTNRKVVA